MKTMIKNVEKNIENIPKIAFRFLHITFIISCVVMLVSILVMMSDSIGSRYDVLFYGRALYHMAYVVLAEGIAFLLISTVIKKRQS